MKSVNQSIIGDDISFELQDGSFLFKNLSFSLNNEKSGLVGKNGVGKTTLLKLLAGELKPTIGKINKQANISYLPQDYQLDITQTIFEALNIKNNSDHGIEDKIINHFKKMNFIDIDFSRPLKTLSGGERMKVVIVKLLISNPDFIILDEPTNNLDYDSKSIVYEIIKNWNKGLLVVSHDRELLNLLDQILELTPKGLSVYGGNYDSYRMQKDIEEEALEKQLVTNKENFNKTKKQAQKTKEKQEKRSSLGKKSRDTGSESKMALNTMKGWAEKTSSKLEKIHKERVGDATKKLKEAKERILPKNKINVDLSETIVPSGKLIIKIKDINFSYKNSSKNLLSDFNLIIHGPAHIAINGPNGIGKTTLVKLITGELKPLSGEVYLGVDRISYLDQGVTILDSKKSLFDNIKELSKLEDYEVRVWLARFLFRADDAFKKVSSLSGGERMRAALACVLAGEKPPQLLILDEPTNNLDIDSIERIESALLNFKGVLIVISHDNEFLNKIGIDREVNLL